MQQLYNYGYQNVIRLIITAKQVSILKAFTHGDPLLSLDLVPVLPESSPHA